MNEIAEIVLTLTVILFPHKALLSLYVGPCCLEICYHGPSELWAHSISLLSGLLVELDPKK